jgi:hypothetical protein
MLRTIDRCTALCMTNVRTDAIELKAMYFSLSQRPLHMVKGMSGLLHICRGGLHICRDAVLVPLRRNRFLPAQQVALRPHLRHVPPVAVGVAATRQRCTSLATARTIATTTGCKA